MISANVKPRILLAALIASAATIPLSNQLNSIAVILFVAACLLQLPLARVRERLSRSVFWMIPVIYFLWIVSTYFWDTSGGFTVKELERYAIFLFVPPAMAFVPSISPKAIRQACMVFVSVTVIVCIMCLIKSYNEYQVTRDYRVYFYHYLSEQMQLNAIFLSNYCLASITWLLYYTFVEKGKRRAIHYLLTLLVASFLLWMIFLLSSKLIIFLTLLIVVVFILVLGYIRGYFLRSILVIALVLLAGFFALTRFSYLAWRINTTEIKMYSGQEDNHNGVAIRLFMWKTVSELISERPLLGYGLKGARVTTLDTYGKKGFEMGVQGNYHSHNQYLESALMAGIPALLILIAFIWYALRNGVKHKNFLLLLMVCHFSIQSLFESTFEVQHELVFYIFFIFLFYYHAAPAGSKMQS